MAIASDSSQKALTGLLKLLADGTRLRILGILEREELSVGELSRCLGLAQSRVSNHLRQLREAGLMAERHVGTSTYLRLAPGQGLVGRLWAGLRDELDSVPEHGADRSRLELILAERRDREDEFFDRVAGRWDTIAGDFSSGQARQRALAHLLPREFTVADLGCGTGYLAEALRPLVQRVICVDRSQGMLTQAEERLQGRTEGASYEFRLGEFDSLPLIDGEVDGVVASMVLHHLADLDRPLHEMHRILRPGGTVAIVELMPHREAWVRSALGDRHLGLEPADVLEALRRAGFSRVSLDPVDDRYRPVGPDGQTAELPLYLARGTSE